MKAFVERDRIILELDGRKRDSLIGWRQAEQLVDALRRGANSAELWLGAPTICTGVWDARVESYDGFVALRFTPPEVGAPSRVPLTAEAARKLADLVEFKGQQAAYKMRFLVSGPGVGCGTRDLIPSMYLTEEWAGKPRPVPVNLE